ncbi:Cyclic nucleotide-binding domain-containing protein [Malonomonas rubra DSM 5091]|uniref:Cyclic nucleotide-binding domain-containing protein n=1 Tax=Malonomonas rubra DSM 5091 TaxID=1122189 RepID=A0A1M6B838_MALRU|nr:cyclic nucleotide-binding domain-containing protein [Malonomonas rubra]SHI44817.1 Cyclic nucleotide-binding domain-containing protein [Malonomonas rubra DSM 5091]
MSQVDFSGLHDSPLFNDMSSDEVNKLQQLFTMKKVEEGKTIFIENMPGESLYLIKQGTVQISRMLAEGDEQVLIVLGPDDIFGEMAVLDGGSRSATARIAEDAILYGLNRKTFDALASKNASLCLKLALNIVRIFSERIRNSQKDYRAMLLASLKRNKSA